MELNVDKITITEALSELNLIKKKVQKKRINVLNNVIRAKHVKDTLESEGGSKEFIKREAQGVEDLNNRFIKLKGAIAKANVETLITVNGKTATIHDWLIWKRDIAKEQITFTTDVGGGVKKHFDQVQRQPQIYKDSEEKTHLVEYEANIDYGEYLKITENLQDTLDKLDGQLSLKNATIVVEA